MVRSPSVAWESIFITVLQTGIMTKLVSGCRSRISRKISSTPQVSYLRTFTGQDLKCFFLLLNCLDTLCAWRFRDNNGFMLLLTTIKQCIRLKNMHWVPVCAQAVQWKRTLVILGQSTSSLFVLTWLVELRQHLSLVSSHHESDVGGYSSPQEPSLVVGYEDGMLDCHYGPLWPPDQLHTETRVLLRFCNKELQDVGSSP